MVSASEGDLPRVTRSHTMKTLSIAIAAAALLLTACGGAPQSEKPLYTPEQRASIIEQKVKDGLVDRCRNELRAELHDPDSFREIEHTIAPHAEVTGYTVGIKYTATNGFGGRITDYHFCNYQKNA